MMGLPSLCTRDTGLLNFYKRTSLVAAQQVARLMPSADAAAADRNADL